MSLSVIVVHLLFIPLLVYCETVSDGGYFVKLMELPAVCPLASFCMPWRPRDSSESNNNAWLANTTLYLLRTFLKKLRLYHRPTRRSPGDPDQHAQVPPVPGRPAPALAQGTSKEHLLVCAEQEEEEEEEGWARGRHLVHDGADVGPDQLPGEKRAA